LLGFAFQRGLLPVTSKALYRALELYGVNVQENKRAFDWGRFAAEKPAEVERLAAATDRSPARTTTLEEAIEVRAQFLTRYQDAAYAERYTQWGGRIRAAEQGVRPGSEELTDAVARSYFALLAYKDEYEVARLYTETEFLADIAQNFGPGAKMTFHMSPPLFARRDPDTGRPKKYELGSWMLPVLKLLARMKRLRGTRLDPFGYTEDRKLERALIERYERTLARLVDELDERRFEIALELARLPQSIRGYGPIKRQAAEQARAREAEWLEQWSSAAARPVSPRRARATAA